MNTRLLLATTAALAFTFAGSAGYAQEAMPMAGGATCAELNAMDAAGQQSFLMGYMAGGRDAMMMNGGMQGGAMATDGAMAPAPDAMAPAPDAMAPAPDAMAAAPGAMAPAPDAMAPAADAMAPAPDAMASGGMMDPQALIDACAATPDAMLGETMMNAMGSM